MEAHIDHRIFNRFEPSLLHLASVKIGVLLLRDFNFSGLMHAYRNIQEGQLIDLHEICEDSKLIKYKNALLKCKSQQLKCEIALLKCKRIFVKRIKALKKRKSALKNRRRSLKKNVIEYCRASPLVKQYRAQQRLMLIPPGLRLTVMKTVQGLEFTFLRWRADHSSILKLKDGEYNFHLKFDGTIDGSKTAQEMALNLNIDIQTRFRLACIYCLEKTIRTLWTKMNASDKNAVFETCDNSILLFWAIRMHQRYPRFPWNQALSEFLESMPPVIILRFSSFFPLLPLRQRMFFLKDLALAKPEDFWLCLHSMTKAEEVRTLELCPSKVLHKLLQWPLRSMFLETAEKMWNYIDEYEFRCVLKRLLSIKKYEEFDNSKLFEDFWKISPKHLKKYAKKCPDIKEGISSWLKEIRRKRKAFKEELRNFKKQG